MAGQRVTLPLAGYIIGLALLALGITIAWFAQPAIPAVIKQWQSSSWPAAAGTVVESDVQTLIDIDRDYRYQITLHTSFSVHGEPYYLYEPYPGVRHKQVEKYAPYTRLTRRFPKDAKVQVYYDPENPNNATLITGLQPGWWITLAIALIPFVLGLWLLLYSLLATARWLRQLAVSSQQ